MNVIIVCVDIFSYITFTIYWSVTQTTLKHNRGRSDLVSTITCKGALFHKMSCGIFCTAYFLQLSQFCQMQCFHNPLIRIKGILFISLVFLLHLFIIIPVDYDHHQHYQHQITHDDRHQHHYQSFHHLQQYCCCADRYI